jgi:hypothetical protein
MSHPQLTVGIDPGDRKSVVCVLDVDGQVSDRATLQTTPASYERYRSGLPSAERVLRAGVIWRKTSFGSKSGKGLRVVERLLSVAETAKKQQRNLFGDLTEAIAAHRNGLLRPRLLSSP